MTIESRSHKAALIYDELGGFDQLEKSRFHSGEDLKHHMCKCMAAYLINKSGRDVGIEVETENGEIDVLSLGESEQHAVAIELETSCSPQKKRSKLEQYQSQLIGEVHTIDISEAPDSIPELEAWLVERLPGV